MARDKIVIDRLRLFGALKRSRKEFMDSVFVINKIIDNMRKDENYHYLSISQDDFNKVSYAKSKYDKLDNSKRVKTSLGRYIRRKMNIKENELNDTVLSNLSDFVAVAIGQKAMNKSKENSSNDDIKILTGKDIQDFYINTDRILHTCMTGAYKTKCIEFYALNPNKVSLITTSNKKARALLWTTDKGVRVLDRIYPNSGSNKKKIQSWAAANKIRRARKTDRITMKHNGVFPYLDVFRYGEIDNIRRAKSYKPGIVVLSNNINFGNAVFTNVAGSFVEQYQCEKCKSRISYYDLLIYTENKRDIMVCNKCFHKNTKTCLYCKQNKSKSDFKGLEKEHIGRKVGVKFDFCYACRTYFDKTIVKCFICNKTVSLGKTLNVSFGNLVHKNICADCFNKVMP